MKSKEIQDQRYVVLVLGVYCLCVGCVLVDIWWGICRILVGILVIIIIIIIIIVCCLIQRLVVFCFLFSYICLLS